MVEQPYTLARWYILLGQEEAFVPAWQALATIFLSLKDPPRWGTLLRSVDDLRLFSSFGRWPSLETIAAMRAHPGSTEAIGKLVALCEYAELSTKLVETTANEGPQLT